MSKFIESIKLRATQNRKKIVLPEGEEIRTLRAAEIILREGISDIVLIGNRERIQKLVSENGINIHNSQILDPIADYDQTMVDYLCKLRKNKGITSEKAQELLKNPLYYGCMLVKMDKADGMVAGAIHSTSDVLRPALQILKTAPNTSFVSALFVMVVPNQDFGSNGVFVFADCGLNANPNPTELAEIAISSAESFRKLVGAEPKVALLSYSTYGSASSELTEKVVQATALAKKSRPDLLIDGELQVDAALIPKIAESKAPGSIIQGNANVLVFPDLNSGNIGYKLVHRLANAEAYGPITQGISKPVNDLSRGCSVEDIVGVVAITSIQCSV